MGETASVLALKLDAPIGEASAGIGRRGLTESGLLSPLRSAAAPARPRQRTLACTLGSYPLAR